jgi:DNA sulfur modification protein DndB
MGGLDYFVSVVTLGEAARMVDYVEDVDSWTDETPPELKLQRKLNLQRVEREMVPYLLSADDHFYSALTVEIRSTLDSDNDDPINFTEQQSFPGGVQFGLLTLDGTECLYALDGQHRLKSIELAIRHKPTLAREHITLILVPQLSLSRSQTLFSDLNRNARVPPKSINLLFTHREELARVSKALAHSVPLLRDRVNMEGNFLANGSRHFVTLSTLYEMSKALLANREGADEQESLTELEEIWLVLSQAIPEWRLVAENEEHPAYLRQRYLHMHGVGQQGIALAIARVRRETPRKWRAAATRLGRLDWQLTNPQWEGVGLQAGRVNNTATSIRLLGQMLQRSLGFSIAEPVESVGTPHEQAATVAPTRTRHH